jgi:putative Ca2+/H+ antiporter (TMEM165/GDT1 family)
LTPRKARAADVRDDGFDPAVGRTPMEPLLVSTALVALAEMGDRTQLLGVALATSFRRPATVLAGIAAGALANHVLAALVGYYVGGLLHAAWFQTFVSLSLIGMAVWTLLQRDPQPGAAPMTGSSAFLTSAGAIFLMEMGDKTQLATAALAAKYHDIVQVSVGSTLGMLVAGAPAVLLGEAITRHAPLRTLRIGGAVLYLALGITGLVHRLRGGS